MSNGSKGQQHGSSLLGWDDARVLIRSTLEAVYKQLEDGYLRPRLEARHENLLARSGTC